MCLLYCCAPDCDTASAKNCKNVKNSNGVQHFKPTNMVRFQWTPCSMLVFSVFLTWASAFLLCRWIRLFSRCNIETMWDSGNMISNNDLQVTTGIQLEFNMSQHLSAFLKYYKLWYLQHDAFLPSFHHRGYYSTIIYYNYLLTVLLCSICCGLPLDSDAAASLSEI